MAIMIMTHAVILVRSHTVMNFITHVIIVGEKSFAVNFEIASWVQISFYVKYFHL